MIKQLIYKLSKWNPPQEFIQIAGSTILFWGVFTYTIWASPKPALNIMMSALWGMAFAMGFLLGMTVIVSVVVFIWYLVFEPLHQWTGRIIKEQEELEKSSKDK